MKLLIVDDHAGVRDMIRQSFAATAQVKECASGEEAVRVAGEFRPDCITMDIRLPGISGMEALRAIIAAGSCGRIVMVSAYDQPELRQAAADAGAAAYVCKDNLAELPLLFAADSGSRSGQAS